MGVFEAPRRLAPEPVELPAQPIHRDVLLEAGHPLDPLLALSGPPVGLAREEVFHEGVHAAPLLPPRLPLVHPDSSLRCYPQHSNPRRDAGRRRGPPKADVASGAAYGCCSSLFGMRIVCNRERYQLRKTWKHAKASPKAIYPSHIVPSVMDE